MPITVNIIDAAAAADDLQKVFDYFAHVEEKFSVFKKDSEMSLINEGKIHEADYSDEMKVVMELCEKTKEETGGFFDIKEPSGRINPSGLVKGWAIYHAAEILKKKGFKNYFVDAGGDIQVSGTNENGKPWNVGIATSGTYERGNHIYNPHSKAAQSDIMSMTVIGPNIYEVDRFATPAFAMGRKGIDFIEQLPGFEAYMIDTSSIATMTSGLNNYFQ